MTNLNIEIEPQHQAIAARLGLALLDGDPDRVDGALSEVAALGLECALAVLAVQTRNLVSALTPHGIEQARAVLQRTTLDAELLDAELTDDQ